MKLQSFTMKLLPILLILFLPFTGFAWQTGEDQPFLSQEFSLSGQEKLHLETSGLSINLLSWEGDEVLVEVYAMRDNKALDPDDPQLEKKLTEFDFNLQQSDQEISLKVSQDKKPRIRMSRDNIVLLIKIQAPSKMSTGISSEGGSVTFSGFDGMQEVNSDGGSIRAIDGKGHLLGNSGGGSIFVDNFEGDLTLKTQGGSVRIEKLTGNIVVNSSGGNLSLFDISGKIVADAAGGSIRASVKKPIEAVTLKSKGGAIDLVLPLAQPLSIDLSGGIVTSQHPDFEGSVRKTKVKGDILGGGIPVAVSAANATVQVSFK
jgi:hypothetical protein